MSLNKRMGDLHEDDIAERFGTRRTRGSGNQWANPMDGRTSRMDQEYAFGWDCKSTLGKSIGVSREMWNKAHLQAMGETPAIPLRFYANQKLEIDLDLVVIDVNTWQALVEDANAYRALEDE